MIDHLDPVLILGGFTQALEHLEEYAYVVALGDPVPIGIHLQSPCESVENKRLGVDDLVGVSDPGEIPDHEGRTLVGGHQLRGEIHRHRTRQGESVRCRLVVDLLQLPHEVAALGDEAALRLGRQVSISGGG